MKKRPTDRVNPNGEGGWFSPHFFQTSISQAAIRSPIPLGLKKFEYLIVDCFACYLIFYLNCEFELMYINCSLYLASTSVSLLIHLSFSSSNFLINVKCVIFRMSFMFKFTFYCFHFQWLLCYIFYEFQKRLVCLFGNLLLRKIQFFTGKFTQMSYPSGMQLPSEIGLKCLI